MVRDSPPPPTPPHKTLIRSRGGAASDGKRHRRATPHRRDVYDHHCRSRHHRRPHRRRIHVKPRRQRRCPAPLPPRTPQPAAATARVASGGVRAVVAPSSRAVTSKCRVFSSSSSPPPPFPIPPLPFSRPPPPPPPLSLSLSLFKIGGRCSRLPSPPASASRSAPPAAAALARAGAIAAAFDSTLHVLARGVARGVLSPTRASPPPRSCKWDKFLAASPPPPVLLSRRRVGEVGGCAFRGEPIRSVGVGVVGGGGGGGSVPFLRFPGWDLRAQSMRMGGGGGYWRPLGRGSISVLPYSI
ncbi:hypothetical protein DAI22_06g268803 [Oryza sativa Japonica Group]|nr:hypothetical protein DAI22_06g268803 [Oryza sativa Japonica Group]